MRPPVCLQIHESKVIAVTIAKRYSDLRLERLLDADRLPLPRPAIVRLRPSWRDCEASYERFRAAFRSAQPFRGLILDIHQIEAAGGSGTACGGTVPRQQDAGHILGCKRAFPGQQECSYQIAYHVVKKSIAADGVDEFVSLALPGGGKDLAHMIVLGFA